MFAAKKVFKYLCTEMKPAAKELDGSKWTKFAKSLPDVIDGKRILQQNSLAQHWARDWRALALTQEVVGLWAVSLVIGESSRIASARSCSQSEACC